MPCFGQFYDTRTDAVISTRQQCWMLPFYDVTECFYAREFLGWIFLAVQKIVPEWSTGRNSHWIFRVVTLQIFLFHFLINNVRVLNIIFRIRFHIVFHKDLCGIKCRIALRISMPKSTRNFLIRLSWKILSRILTFSRLTKFPLYRKWMVSMKFHIFVLGNTIFPRLHIEYIPAGTNLSDDQQGV